MSMSIWNGLTGDWGNAADWTGGIPNAATAAAILSGTAAYGVTIGSGESFATSVTMLSDANALLAVSGTLNAGTLNVSAGMLLLASGGTIGGGTVISSATEQVYGAGSATILLNGGIERVYAGGVALGTAVSGGGTLAVSSGGTASGARLSSGGFERIVAGVWPAAGWRSAEPLSLYPPGERMYRDRFMPPRNMC